MDSPVRANGQTDINVSSEAKKPYRNANIRGLKKKKNGTGIGICLPFQFIFENRVTIVRSRKHCEDERLDFKMRGWILR